MLELPIYAVKDGGLSTFLISHGFPLLESDPLWSARLLIDQLPLVEDAHLKFLQNGATVIETNTYQANLFHLKRHADVTDEGSKKVLCDAVMAAQRARDRFPGSQNSLIGGCVGPYGACLHDGSEYTGKYVETISSDTLSGWHEKTIDVLLCSGVDLLCFDTLPAQKEAEVLAQLLAAEFPNSRAWMSFSCRDSEYTNHGERLIEAASTIFNSSQVSIVGINCTNPCYVTPLLRQLQRFRDHKRIVVFPNSGESWDAAKSEWIGDGNLKPLSSYVAEWMDLGANWIGGCCRTIPDDISGIKIEMEKWLKGVFKTF